VAGVAGAAPFVRSEVLAVHQAGDGRKHLETATFIGIDPELEPTVTRNLDIAFPSFQGFTPDPDWQLLGGSGNEEGLLLGVELAAGLRIGIGERLQLIIPDAASSRASNLDSIGGRHVWRRVLGLIDGGLYEFNATRAYGEIGPTLDFLRVAGEAQGIGVRCVRPERASALADSLLALPALRGYEAETWQSRNQVLFEAMAREKMLMYLFLLLTVGVASLGIVGTMTLMISERRPQIGILRTLGMNKRAVMAMVVLEGWLVGIAGVAGGLAGGWGLGVLLREHPLRIPWDLFVIETVPILLNPIDFIWVGSITLAVSLLAALYPGWEAARMDPIKAIRSI
jgi:lipoprotein-releasing system permease protein